MFRPRYAYKSSISKRFRGKLLGCPPVTIISSSTSDIVVSDNDIKETDNELKKPRLKLNERRIKNILRRPLKFRISKLSEQRGLPSNENHSSPCLKPEPKQDTLDRSNFELESHIFQAPPKFVNTLKPCPTQIPELTPQPKPQPRRELLRCAICGVREVFPAVKKIHGQLSCIDCAEFFADYRRKPRNLCCTQDSDCLMTVDSRCEACWIRICNQKFDIESDRRNVNKQKMRVSYKTLQNKKPIN